MNHRIAPLAGLSAFALLCVGAGLALYSGKPQREPAYGASAPAPQPATIKRVLDGDTVELSDGRHCRLQFIDAPELKQPSGEPAKQFLMRQLEGRNVLVMFGKLDKYQRPLVTIYTEVNIEMVNAGLAWSYDKTYLDQEARARKGRCGLWADPNCISPSEWRRGVRPKPAIPHEDDE